MLGGQLVAGDRHGIRTVVSWARAGSDQVRTTHRVLLVGAVGGQDRPAGPRGSLAPSRRPRDTPTAGELPPLSRPDRPLRVRILGNPALYTTADGLRQVAVPRRTAVELLVLLAVHHDGLTASQVMEAMWPDVALHAATNRLYTTVSTLRTTTKPAANGDLVVRRDDRYRLNPDLATVDLWDLHTAVHTAATTTGTTRLTALRRVTDLHTGELAAGAGWPCLTPHGEPARRHTLDAYTTLAEAASDPHDAITLLHAALDIEPLNTALHHTLITASRGLGDLDTAAQLEKTYTEHLAEYGIAPAQT